MRGHDLSGLAYKVLDSLDIWDECIFSDDVASNAEYERIFPSFKLGGKPVLVAWGKVARLWWGGMQSISGVVQYPTRYR